MTQTFEQTFTSFVSTKEDKLSLARGGTPMAVRSAEDLSDDDVNEQLAAGSSADLLRLELELAVYEEALEALGEYTEVLAEQPNEAQVWLKTRTRQTEIALRETIASTVAETRLWEKPIRQMYSFYVEAKIPANGAALRSRIEAFTGTLEEFVMSAEVGQGETMAPASSIGPLHRLQVAMLVGGEVNSSTVFNVLARKAKDHGAMALCVLPSKKRHRVDEIRGDIDGHEHVLLVDAEIRSRKAYPGYERPDDTLTIGGSFSAAGMAFHNALVSSDKGIMTGLGDFTAASNVSDGYSVSDEQGPFASNYGLGKLDVRPEGVIVGGEMTNPQTETTSVHVFIGNQTARGPDPAYQFAVMMALCSLQHTLQIKSPLLMKDRAARAKVLVELQRQLGLRYVGTGDKHPFTQLTLSEDTESEEAQRTIARGGVRIKAIVGIKDTPTEVFTDIYP